MNGGLSLIYQFVFADSNDNHKLKEGLTRILEFTVIVLSYYFINLAYGAGYSLTAVTGAFPTALKGTVFGICNALGRTGAVLAPEVAWLTSSPLLIFGGAGLAIGGLCLVGL